MTHPQPSSSKTNSLTSSGFATGSERRRLIPNEVTGASFPALYLVRSSWLIRWLARVTFFFLLIGFVALIFVPWQQSSRGQGRVVARDPQQRPQTIAATYDGIIKWIKPGIQEGSPVEKDDVIIKLEPFAREELDQLKNSLMQVEAKRDAAQRTVETSQINVRLQEDSGRAEILSEQLAVDAARAKWNQEKALLASAQAEYRPKKLKYDSYKDLYQSAGTVSGQDVQNAFGEEQAAEQKIVEAEQKVDEAFQTLNSKEHALESKRQSVEVKNNEVRNKYQADLSKLAETEKEINDTKLKLGALERLDIVSPRSGIIQQLQINAGSDAVKKGDPLFTVVPESTELAVELTIAGNDSPLVKVGDEVRLQFQGWPAIQWVGWPSVAVGTFGGSVNSINPSDDGKGDFIVYVTPDTQDMSQEPWPDNRYLRQGVRANGWVLLDTVSLGYELWRQLNGFPPILDQSSKDEEKKDGPKKIKLPK
jgi:multidrug resistance efflux pump